METAVKGGRRLFCISANIGASISFSQREKVRALAAKLRKRDAPPVLRDIRTHESVKRGKKHLFYLKSIIKFTFNPKIINATLNV